MSLQLIQNNKIHIVLRGLESVGGKAGACSQLLQMMLPIAAVRAVYQISVGTKIFGLAEYF